MTKKEFLLLFEIKKNGLSSYRDLNKKTGVSIGLISKIIKNFKEEEYIYDGKITEKGIKKLSPYKVDNAIIMAAGMSTRFVPLSLEMPKGLLKVKNEVLVERQIEQLQQAGISDIVIILGYKKEAFFYLENKYDGIKFIINPEYNIKNNTHSLYLAKNYIRNSYICSSDNYFVENPFNEYEFESFYSGVNVNEKTNEWYMIPDSKKNIAKVEKSGNKGIVMLGHAYWNEEFSDSMAKILDEDYSVGNYYQSLWEEILIDNVKKLPKMKIKEYPVNMIFEFDSLEELREFDDVYVNNTGSKILDNIINVFKCKEEDVINFKKINEGLTNTSFSFVVNGKKYVYRHPGEGTEEIISRKHEKMALELAKKNEIDPTYIYMNEDEGWKISEYVDNIRIPRYDSVEDSRRVIRVLKKLHSKNLSVDWSFEPWNEAKKIEDILKKSKQGILDKEFNELKKNVEKCFNACKDDIEMCFCHCDTYAPNWMIDNKGNTILIDWEYAGNADPGCDVGTYIMDSMWEIEDAKKFIAEYLGDKSCEKYMFHYMAYVSILSYYWYVWALYRESCGAIMGESLYNWHLMAKKYSDYLVRNNNL